MSSFTEQIKLEIISNGFETIEQKTAAFYAFLRTSGSVIYKDGFYGFEFVTGNEYTADFFSNIISQDFHLPFECETHADLPSFKQKYIFSSSNEQSQKFLLYLNLIFKKNGSFFLNFDIPDKIVSTDESLVAFIKGAFLGGGSCTIPDESAYSTTGYHLEIVFSKREIARSFCELLCGCDILSKLVTRKDYVVVYIKSREVISDFLYLISAFNALDELGKIIESKEQTNNANRTNNCSVSNIDKTVTASVKQVKAIETISQVIGLKNLDRGLFDVAEARLADKNASMQELADRLGISKSCINHRIRKLIAMANELGE